MLTAILVLMTSAILALTLYTAKKIVEDQLE